MENENDRRLEELLKRASECEREKRRRQREGSLPELPDTKVDRFHQDEGTE